MATLDPSCDVCLNLHVTKSASVWCSECEEAICEDCEPRHRTQKATKNHKTIPIADYKELPISITNIKVECEDHNQKLDFYCSIHSEPCCTRCVSEKHRDCRELKPLPEVIDGVKSSAAFFDVENRVKDMSKLIGQMIQEKKDNKSNLEVKKKTLVAEVERVRKSINKHLDSIQGELLSKIVENERREGEKINCVVSKLSKIKTNVDEIANAVEKTMQHASNFQTFLGVIKWNREMENQEKEIISAQSDQSMANIDIQITMNPFLVKIEQEISEFGKLDVNFLQPTKLVFRKEKQGQQLLIPLTQSINKIKVSQIRSFSIPKGEKGCIITGCDMFEDGRIVFADFNIINGRLIVMNSGGSFIKGIPFEDKPVDVSVIDSNTAAVTLMEKRCISIVDVNTTNVIRTIPVYDKCYGICYTDGKLVITVANKLINIVDLSGNVLSTVSQIDEATYCSAINDKIYYATEVAEVIYCCDLNGSVTGKFKCGTSDDPLGITNDASENVYITCKKANKVIVIEPSLKESRVLLNSDDGLNRPRAIRYIREKDILLVCNVSGQCFMFKIMK